MGMVSLPAQQPRNWDQVIKYSGTVTWRKRKIRKKDDIDLWASDIDASGEGYDCHGHHVRVRDQVPRPGNPGAGAAWRAGIGLSKPKFITFTSFVLEVTVGVDWHLIRQPHDAIEEVTERQVEDEDSDRAGNLVSDVSMNCIRDGKSIDGYGCWYDYSEVEYHRKTTLVVDPCIGEGE